MLYTIYIPNMLHNIVYLYSTFFLVLLSALDSCWMWKGRAHGDSWCPSASAVRIPRCFRWLRYVRWIIGRLSRVLRREATPSMGRTTIRYSKSAPLDRPRGGGVWGRWGRWWFDRTCTWGIWPYVHLAVLPPVPSASHVCATCLHGPAHNHPRGSLEISNAPWT